MKRKMLWGVVSFAAVIAILVVLPLIVPIYVPWSAINCRYEDVNIVSGHARYSRSWWYIVVSERIEETALSTALNSSLPDPSAWRRANLFDGRRPNSPHYRFHSALSQIQEFDMLTWAGNLDSQEKQKLAKQIIAAWQRHNGDAGANPIFSQLTRQLDAAGVFDRPR
ncbi:MAG: hypothetical protein AAF581_03125 [Planctomycetota bacterium]